MCGRYTIIARAEEIEKRFNIEVPEFYEPRYNAAPSQVLPVITNQSPEGLSFFRWGLIPFWAKDKSIGYKMIWTPGNISMSFNHIRMMKFQYTRYHQGSILTRTIFRN